MIMLRRFSVLLLALAAAFGLASCASVSVESGNERSTKRMPAKIYVAPFDAAGGTFAVDREGAELAEFKRGLQEILQKAAVADLTRRLVPAAEAKGREGIKPENAWLVRGEFTKVKQGSRLLRATIGFGAGGTKLETRVAVYDLNRADAKPFLTFTTTGGSGAEPGAISGAATDPVVLVVGAAASAGGVLAHGLSEDAARTARQITAVLSDYMYRRDWIPEEKWIAPKRREK